MAYFREELVNDGMNTIVQGMDGLRRPEVKCTIYELLNKKNTE